MSRAGKCQGSDLPADRTAVQPDGVSSAVAVMAIARQLPAATSGMCIATRSAGAGSRAGARAAARVRPPGGRGWAG